jgi:hypothetical protein
LLCTIDAGVRPNNAPIHIATFALPTFSAELTDIQKAFWTSYSTEYDSKISATDTNYLNALRHFQNGNFIEALKLLNSALAIEPQHEDAQHLKNTILACLGIDQYKCRIYSISK